MRFVYVDEAGTSANEPVMVVVSIIVDADRQLIQAEMAVAEVLGDVPPDFSEGFVFHATDIWGSPAYRDRWMMADRVRFLKNMMALPRRLGLVLSLAIVRKNLAPEIQPLPGMVNQAQMQHFVAFMYSLGFADTYIRDKGASGEVGTAVVEDVPEMRQFLARVPALLRDNPIVLPPNSIRRTEKEMAQGYSEQNAVLRTSRIRNSVHFVNKGDDAVLQISDACAFGFRRYFASQGLGRDFCDAIVGSQPNERDWSGPMSAQVIDFGAGRN